MEENNVKSHKPSKLRPPQVRGMKTRRLSDDKNPLTVTAPPSKILKRRSKSFADLRDIGRKYKNVEEMPTSTLYKPVFKAPLIKRSKLQPLSENATNLPSTSTVALLPGALSTKSKSIADLQLDVKKPKIMSKTTCKVQRVESAANKTAQKRKGEKSSDEGKPKVVKQAKIPDWDYKARYNQLREKYTVLNEEHKKQKDKIEEFNVLEEKYTTVRNEYDTVSSKYRTLTNLNCNTVAENKILKERASELDERLSVFARQCEDLKQLLNTKIVECEKLSHENEGLSREHGSLSTDYSNLKASHAQLTKEHEQVVETLNVLKADYDKIVAENEELKLNVTLGSKRITELSEQNAILKKDLYNGEDIRRKLHNVIQDLKGNIRVYCRVRPPIRSEEDFPQCVVNFIDDKTIEIRKSRESISAISGKPTDIKAEFTVDKIFEPNTSQREIFEEFAQLVQSALDGYDVCVFAYGQTGSGKTYTMQGEETLEKKGIIPRTIDLIFDSIRNLRTSGWCYEISASFLEIYNENVRDLLNLNPALNLEIRFNEGKGTTVTNLSIQKLESAEELKNLLTIAQRNRAVATTDFNEHSSRSHAVTKIYLKGSNSEMNATYTGSINLVDLAGSESAKTSSNERLVETKNINRSLSALECVMLSLYNKEKHVPYRNSKLTYLLQSCLGGSSKTLMIVNIAPFEECFTESIFSLRFATKVKEVKTNAKRNKTYFASTSSTKM
ncbi:carboxy-terminal kinesin 2 [Anoplophora glabripennis]|uniref:carboxy-terminal kinesin 2 n=1 Tax=Anoplophora glabripennis TaxID=217634 RepID=UPI0008748FDC|nr:carboxy-terminal kinesin 2 [Anoplophora glabripennis]